jgi:prepilin peptidase CpaA
VTQEILRWGLAGLFTSGLLAAAVSDYLRRRIPNWVVVALIALYFAAVLARISPTAVLSGLAAAGITFVVTYLLYHFNIFGAGDAKLFTAVALFAGLTGLGTLALTTVLIGGAMALVVLVLRPGRAIRAITTRGRSSGERSGIPYGVAIALGAIVTAWLTPGFYPRIG